MTEESNAEAMQFFNEGIGMRMVPHMLLVTQLQPRKTISIVVIWRRGEVAIRTMKTATDTKTDTVVGYGYGKVEGG